MFNYSILTNIFQLIMNFAEFYQLDRKSNSIRIILICLLPHKTIPMILLHSNNICSVFYIFHACLHQLVFFTSIYNWIIFYLNDFLFLKMNFNSRLHAEIVQIKCGKKYILNISYIIVFNILMTIRLLIHEIKIAYQFVY